ncbi:MAG TPA: hypothetical protein VEG44_00335 [Candidatus Acidoferrales bacterium]|nr:hypothetical protein [Candidatus Acidoferrales bacterium]
MDNKKAKVWKAARYYWTMKQSSSSSHTFFDRKFQKICLFLTLTAIGYIALRYDGWTCRGSDQEALKR